MEDDISGGGSRADHVRLTRVRSAMVEAGLDALVCRLPENVLMLSGHWPLVGISFLLFPREEQPVLVVPHCDEQEARTEAWEARLEPFLFGVLGAPPPFDSLAAALRTAVGTTRLSRVGYEGSFEFTAPAWNTAENAVPSAVSNGILQDVFGADALVDATSFLHSQRARKTPLEAAGIRQANAVAALGIEVFHEMVRPGADGVTLAAEVERAIVVQGAHRLGLRRVRGFAQVATGPEETVRGFRPMELMTTRPMIGGDIALMELAVVANGFWADRTRVCVAGQPTDRQVDVFETIRAAQEAAIAMIRPGVSAGDADAAARSVVNAAGLGAHFVHVTGHGLGFRYHEPSPTLMPGSEEQLEEGMTLTVEPGVYIDGVGGIRIEDNLLVTESGAELLGPAPKQLSP